MRALKVDKLNVTCLAILTISLSGCHHFDNKRAASSQRAYLDTSNYYSVEDYYTGSVKAIDVKNDLSRQANLKSVGTIEVYPMTKPLIISSLKYQADEFNWENEFLNHKIVDELSRLNRKNPKFVMEIKSRDYAAVNMENWEGILEDYVGRKHIIYFQERPNFITPEREKPKLSSYFEKVRNISKLGPKHFTYNTEFTTREPVDISKPFKIIIKSNIHNNAQDITLKWEKPIH